MSIISIVEQEIINTVQLWSKKLSIGEQEIKINIFIQLINKSSIGEQEIKINIFIQLILFSKLMWLLLKMSFFSIHKIIWIDIIFSLS